MVKITNEEKKYKIFEAEKFKYRLGYEKLEKLREKYPKKPDTVSTLTILDIAKNMRLNGDDLASGVEYEKDFKELVNNVLTMIKDKSFLKFEDDTEEIIESKEDATKEE